jgi:thioredoxin reductase (NADPH)
MEAKVYDVVMIGAGPTSLAAAVYTAREDIETLIFEKGVVGGLAAITDQIDNYPGFEEGVEGLVLAEKLQKQAERFGAVIELGEVESIKKTGENFELQTTSGPIKTKTVLIATGSEWKKIGIPGEIEFYGRGVHNCATCDGAFYRDKKLVVVGGGNSSAQEALFLTKFASHIDILIRGDKWKASDVLIHEIDKNDKISVHFKTTTDEIVGGEIEGINKVTSVKAKKGGKDVEFETDGVFVFIGLKPVTYFLEDSGVKMDQFGFVVTDDKLMTNVPGIFCAGDVRSGATMQIASAVGEGAAAALSIREYLENYDRNQHAATNGD